MALTCLAAPLKATLPLPRPPGDWINVGSILLFRPQLKNTMTCHTGAWKKTPRASASASASVNASANAVASMELPSHPRSPEST